MKTLAEFLFQYATSAEDIKRLAAAAQAVQYHIDPHTIGVEFIDSSAIIFCKTPSHENYYVRL
jgi:hypothetical protein